MYYKMRCNSTQFVMYYKLRNYYNLQRNKAHSLLRKKSSECLFKNNLWWWYLIFIEKCSMENHWATTKHLYVGCCYMWWGQAAMSLDSFDLTVMHVVNRIFIISVSNSWMFTYHDKWNRNGNILNRCCPSMAFRRVYFTTIALNLWLLRQCEYNPQFRRRWEHLLTLLMSVIISLEC